MIIIFGGNLLKDTYVCESDSMYLKSLIINSVNTDNYESTFYLSFILIHFLQVCIKRMYVCCVSGSQCIQHVSP